MFADLPAHSGMRQIIFESHPEKKTLLLLLARCDIFDIWDQPPEVKYTRRNGDLAKHTFDYLATFASGEKVAIAVKPASRAQRLNFLQELAAVEACLSPTFADRVALVTEHELDPLEVRNAALLHMFRQMPDTEADQIIADELAVLREPVLLADLVKRTGLEARAFRAVFKAIYSKLALVPAGDVISYRTTIFPVSAVEEL